MFRVEDMIEIGCGELVAVTAPSDVAVELVCTLVGNTSNSNNGNSLLYVPGNSSVVLPRFNRIKVDFEVRRSFTVYQLMQILEEAHQNVIFVEYDVELWEASLSTEILESVMWRMKELTLQGASVVVYAPRMDALDSLREYVGRFINVNQVNRVFEVRDSSTGLKLVNNQNRSLSDFYG